MVAYVGIVTKEYQDGNKAAKVALQITHFSGHLYEASRILAIK